MNNISNKKEVIVDITEIQKILWDYYEQLCASKLETYKWINS